MMQQHVHMPSKAQQTQTQQGAVATHLIALLAVGLLCFAAVSLFYYLTDSRFSAMPPGQKTLSAAGSGGGGNDSLTLPQPEHDDHAAADKEVITRRNVFLPRNGRANRDMAAELLSGAAGEAPDLVLVGTAVGIAGESRAVIFDGEQKKQHLVREGDVINGASIRVILSGKVLISRQGREEILDIAEASRLRAVIRAAAPPEQPRLEDLQNVVIPAGQEPIEEVPAAENQGTISDNESAPLRVNLNQLGRARQDIIVKGRMSSEK